VEAQTDKHAAAVTALRTDIANLRVELRSEIAAIRGEMALRSETGELRREMAALRTDMRSDMAALRTELHGGIEGLRTDLREVSRRTDRLVFWVAGTQAAVFLAAIGVLVEVIYR